MGMGMEKEGRGREGEAVSHAASNHYRLAEEREGASWFGSFDPWGRGELGETPGPGGTRLILIAGPGEFEKHWLRSIVATLALP